MGVCSHGKQQKHWKDFVQAGAKHQYALLVQIHPHNHVNNAVNIIMLMLMAGLSFRIRHFHHNCYHPINSPRECRTDLFLSVMTIHACSYVASNALRKRLYSGVYVAHLIYFHVRMHSYFPETWYNKYEIVSTAHLKGWLIALKATVAYEPAQYNGWDGTEAG